MTTAARLSPASLASLVGILDMPTRIEEEFPLDFGWFDEAGDGDWPEAIRLAERDAGDELRRACDLLRAGQPAEALEALEAADKAERQLGDAPVCRPIRDALAAALSAAADLAADLAEEAEEAGRLLQAMGPDWAGAAAEGDALADEWRAWGEAPAVWGKQLMLPTPPEGWGPNGQGQLAAELTTALVEGRRKAGL